MSDTTKVIAGDVVLLRFPHTNLSPGKLRPALVIATLPGYYPDVLLAMITSHLYQAIPNFDEIITPNDADFVESGLRVPSVIKIARLATIEAALINAKLGSISSERLVTIQQQLTKWLNQ